MMKKSMKRCLAGLTLIGGGAAVVGIGGASSGAVPSATVRLGSGEVAVATMVSRPVTPCAPPGCTARPGRLLPLPQGAVVVEAENALFGQVELPTGARLLRLELTGFDENAVSSSVHLNAALYRVDDKSLSARLIAQVSTRGGASGVVMKTARRVIQNPPRVQEGSAYYIQLTYPPAEQQARPVGASLVKVVYRVG